MPVSDLRNRLQQRIDNIRGADFQRLVPTLRYLTSFISESPLLRGVTTELRSHEVSILPAVEWVRQLRTKRRAPIYDNEVLNACFCQSIIDYVIKSGTEKVDVLFRIITRKTTRSEQLFEFNEVFINPFHQYINERIDDFNLMLYLLQKYKYACEWFEKARLYSMYKEDESRGEASLDRELRKFLFFQGVEYPFSSPLSASGRADVVAELGTENPLVLEIKIFDLNKGYDRAYMRQGLRQALLYANDYNEAIGYLFLYKTCERDLVFDLSDKSLPPKITVADKTIFLVQADIFVHKKTASKRRKLEPYVIDETYLISSE